MRHLKLLLLVLASVLFADAQTTINGARSVSSTLDVSGTATFTGTTKTVNFEASLPATCTAPSGSTPGELVFRTSDNTLHACTATNTFTQIGGGSSSTSLLDQIYQQLAENWADEIDLKITSGRYVVLIHKDLNASSGYLSPSNALHTVTTGRIAIVVATWAGKDTTSDPTFRGMRLRNTSAGSDIISQSQFTTASIFFNGTSDTTNSYQNVEIAAGTNIELQTYNSDANQRSRSGIVVLYEVDAP